MPTPTAEQLLQALAAPVGDGGRVPKRGYLGVQHLGDEGVATEYATTIPHPTQFGKWINTPLLTPNQIATDTLPGPVVTPEQYDRANEFARWRTEQGGVSAYDTLARALRAVAQRHRQFHEREK